MLSSPHFLINMFITVLPKKLGQTDDVTTGTLPRDKHCKFEAPPPTTSPPPISVDLSTQVYVTKRDSLTSGEYYIVT